MICILKYVHYLRICIIAQDQPIVLYIFPELLQGQNIRYGKVKHFADRRQVLRRHR